jgi:hypothetical protein
VTWLTPPIRMHLAGETAVRERRRMRIRALAVTLVLAGAGTCAQAWGWRNLGSALRAEDAWARVRELLPGSGCGICGQVARFDVTRLVRKQGTVVGRVRIGLRCDAHREAESASIESGRSTAWLLVGLGGAITVLALATGLRPLVRGTGHPLWPGSRLRPARQAALVLSGGIWWSVAVYVLAVSFKEAYASVPLWLIMGGMLCMWLYDLLSGGEYLRCTVCEWRGNLKDVAHFRGACPRCDSRHFCVQELIAAHRAGIKTTYHFRVMSGLTLIQLDELDRDGRIWKEPRGAWSPQRGANGAGAPPECGPPGVHARHAA